MADIVRMAAWWDDKSQLRIKILSFLQPAPSPLEALWGHCSSRIQRHLHGIQAKPSR